MPTPEEDAIHAEAKGAAAWIRDDEDLYAILGVTNKATLAELKRALNAKRLVTHPDKTGGPPEPYMRVDYAFRMLNSPKTRELYDTHGHRGLRGEVASSSSDSEEPSESLDAAACAMAAAIAQLFRMHREARQAELSASSFARASAGAAAAPPTRVKGNTVRRDLELTLDELYSETPRMIRIERHRLVPGSRNGDTKYVVLDYKLQPKRWWRSGETICLPGESDESVSTIAGDIVIHIDVRPHADFVVGDDGSLTTTCEVSLADAVCGCTVHFLHLDGELIPLSCREYLLGATGARRVVANRGLSRKRGSEVMRSDLLVNFRVTWPPMSLSIAPRVQRELARAFRHAGMPPTDLASMKEAEVIGDGDEDADAEDDDPTLRHSHPRKRKRPVAAAPAVDTAPASATATATATATSTHPLSFKRSKPTVSLS